MEILQKKVFSIEGRYNRLALVEFHIDPVAPVRLIYSVPFSGKHFEVKHA
jgi:hypothetical protein